MKKIVGLLLCLCILSNCNTPKNYLKDKRPIAAFQSCLSLINNGSFSKKHVAYFAKSFHQINKSPILKIEHLRQGTNSKRWIDIYNNLKSIESQQLLVKKYEKTLNERGFFPKLTYYPTHPIINQVKDSIAAYYYNEAEQYVHEARSENRTSARYAFEDLLKVKEFNSDYLDTKSLSIEMQKLGTINILIDTTHHNFDNPLNAELLPFFLKDQQYPVRKNWILYHLNSQTQIDFDYTLDLTFGPISVSDDQVNQNACTNSKSVYDGTEEVSVWDAETCEYITECESVYKDVYVVVYEITQSKTARAKIFLDLFNNKEGVREHSLTLDHVEKWTNTYSNHHDRDPDAFGHCYLGGVEKKFPSREEILSFAFKKLKLNLFEKLNDNINQIEDDIVLNR